MREHALIYLGENDQDKKNIISLLNDFSFHYTFLNDEDLSKRISSLFHKQTETNGRNDAFSFNFIFFKNINHEQILAFYRQCEENGYPFSHKAVMTSHNQNWILKDLLTEIEEEHTFFQQWSILNSLLKEANDCDPLLYTEASFEPYKIAFINAYIYRKQPNPNKENIKQYIHEIIKTKNELILK